MRYLLTFFLALISASRLDAQINSVGDHNQNIGNNHGVVVNITNSNTTVQPQNGKATPDSLKRRVSSMAETLIRFTDKRIQICESVLSDHEQDSVHRYGLCNADTFDKFTKLYWPTIQGLLSEMETRGQDTSAVTKTLAENHGGRWVALRLSVMAERIGRRPPYPRIITPLEAKVIVVGIFPKKVALSATPDKNSQTAARALQQEFIRNRWSGAEEIHKLTFDPGEFGIHLVYPARDMMDDDLATAIQACDLQLQQDLDTKGANIPLRDIPSIIHIYPESSQTQ